MLLTRSGKESSAWQLSFLLAIDCTEGQGGGESFLSMAGRAFFREVALQLGDALFKSQDMVAQGGDFGFEIGEAGGRGGRSIGNRSDLSGDGVAEEMDVAGFAGAGLARKHKGERAGAGIWGGWIGGFTMSEAFEGGLDGGNVVEAVEAVGTAAQFAGSLRAAEKQEAEDGRLVAAEIEDGAGTVLELGDAGVADRGGKSEIFEGVEGLTNLLLVQIEDGIAAGTLVAGGEKRIEGEGVDLGRGDLFFNESAENAELDGIERHG